MKLCNIFNINKLIYHLNNTFMKFIIPDKIAIKAIYKHVLKSSLNIKNPITYNEKLQWLKLYDHNDFYTTLVDKYRVKDYIANQIGFQYVVPLLGVWDKAEDIDFDSLPNQFVLKTNHDSKGVCICRDKTTFNCEEARKKMKECLNRNFYYVGREWPYKNVNKCIIAEKYIIDKQDRELRDYKFFCFNGTPKILYITKGERMSGKTYNSRYFCSIKCWRNWRTFQS